MSSGCTRLIASNDVCSSEKGEWVQRFSSVASLTWRSFVPIVSNNLSLSASSFSSVDDEFSFRLSNFLNAKRRRKMFFYRFGSPRFFPLPVANARQTNSIDSIQSTTVDPFPSSPTARPNLLRPIFAGESVALFLRNWEKRDGTIVRSFEISLPMATLFRTKRFAAERVDRVLKKSSLFHVVRNSKISGASMTLLLVVLSDENAHWNLKSRYRIEFCIENSHAVSFQLFVSS